MKYILNSNCELRGWYKLPFAIYSNGMRKAFFYDREQYDLILDCDGHKDIDKEKLTAKQKVCLDELIKNHIVLETEEEKDLLINQLYKTYDNPFKEDVHWSITGKCNYKCKHCFMDAPIGAQGEPSFLDLCKMLDAFKRCGIKSVGITGGEPLVYPRFWDVVDECIKRDIRINVLYSNGKLITREVLEKLKEKKVFCAFQFSFDGVGWHDWLRGIDGAEKAVDNAFLLCREFGATTSASMCLHKYNVNCIEESIKHLVDLGCHDLKINLASPSGAWAKQTENFLSIDEYFQTIVDFIPKYYEMGAPINLVIDSYFQVKRTTGKWSMACKRRLKEENLHLVPVCACIKRDLYVSPRGIVMPCMPIAETPLEYKYPNMLEEPLENILKDSFYSKTCNATVKEMLDNNNKCNTCEYRLDCAGGCRGKAAHSAEDSFYKEEEEICKFFKEGWAKKVEEVANKAFEEYKKLNSK